MFEMIPVPQGRSIPSSIGVVQLSLSFMIPPILVANSLILISVRYDITYSQTAHQRILKVSEFSYGVYGCKDEFECASYDL